MLRVRSSLSYPALERRASAPLDARSPAERAAAPPPFLFWLAVFSTTLSSFAMGWACVQLNSATGDASARGTLRLSDARLTTCTGVLYLAAALAALLSDRPLDALGRRATLLGTAAGFVAGAALCAVDALAALLLGRALCGAACGVALSAVPTLLTEIAPAAHRGRVVYLGPVATALGELACSAFGWWACVALDGGWRYVTAALAAPAALQLALGALGVLPESPHFLLRARGLDAALDALRPLRAGAAASDAALRAELLGEGFGGDGGGGGGGGDDGGDGDDDGDDDDDDDDTMTTTSVRFFFQI